MYVPIFRGLDVRAWWQKTTNRHTHTFTHTRNNYNEHNTNKNRRGHNFIGVAMQPESLVAATLAVSQEQKSFRTNHTSILNILNTAILKISMGQTNTHTHTHKTTTITLAVHARKGLMKSTKVQTLGAI